MSRATPIDEFCDDYCDAKCKTKPFIRLATEYCSQKYREHLTKQMRSKEKVKSDKG